MKAEKRFILSEFQLLRYENNSGSKYQGRKTNENRKISKFLRLKSIESRIFRAAKRLILLEFQILGHESN